MLMKFYGIYKITNLVNGKMYIGKHVTSDLDDGYMGSGIVINNALKKYGKENFCKEWLMFCEDEEELNYMERVFVDQTWIDRSDTYNLKIGGEGGFQKELWLGRKRSIKNRQRLSNALKGHTLSEKSKEKISQKNKGKTRPTNAIENQRISIKKTLSIQGIWNKGKKCPQISGEKNGGYKKFKGTHYYNNGIVQVRAYECPEGFVEGGLKRNRKDIA